MDYWLGGKPNKELTNHFLTKDFVKINERVQQTTILDVNRTAYIGNLITYEILSFSPYIYWKLNNIWDTVIFSLQMHIASFQYFVLIVLRKSFYTTLDTDLVILFKTGQWEIGRLNHNRFHVSFSIMLHISFEDNGMSNFVDCILLMAPQFAVLSDHSLKVSPQVEGIQQKVALVPFYK